MNNKPQYNDMFEAPDLPSNLNLESIDTAEELRALSKQMEQGIKERSADIDKQLRHSENLLKKVMSGKDIDAGVQVSAQRQIARMAYTLHDPYRDALKKSKGIFRKILSSVKSGDAVLNSDIYIPLFENKDMTLITNKYEKVHVESMEELLSGYNRTIEELRKFERHSHEEIQKLHRYIEEKAMSDIDKMTQPGNETIKLKRDYDAEQVYTMLNQCVQNKGNCKMILEITKDVNVQDENGHSALHIAAGFGNLEVVKTLVENNAKLDLKDSSGRSVLTYAIENDSQKDSKLNIVQYLVENGADLKEKRASDGKTPLDVAKEVGAKDIVTYLESLDTAESQSVTIAGKKLDIKTTTELKIDTDLSEEEIKDLSKLTNLKTLIALKVKKLPNELPNVVTLHAPLAENIPNELPNVVTLYARSAENLPDELPNVVTLDASSAEEIPDELPNVVKLFASSAEELPNELPNVVTLLAQSAEELPNEMPKLEKLLTKLPIDTRLYPNLVEIYDLKEERWISTEEYNKQNPPQKTPDQLSNELKDYKEISEEIVQEVKEGPDFQGVEFTDVMPEQGQESQKQGDIDVSFDTYTIGVTPDTVANIPLGAGEKVEQFANALKEKLGVDVDAKLYYGVKTINGEKHLVAKVLSGTEVALPEAPEEFPELQPSGEFPSATYEDVDDSWKESIDTTLQSKETEQTKVFDEIQAQIKALEDEAAKNKENIKDTLPDTGTLETLRDTLIVDADILEATARNLVLKKKEIETNLSQKIVEAKKAAEARALDAIKDMPKDTPQYKEQARKLKQNARLRVANSIKEMEKIAAEDLSALVEEYQKAVDQYNKDEAEFYKEANRIQEELAAPSTTEAKTVDEGKEVAKGPAKPEVKPNSGKENLWLLGKNRALYDALKEIGITKNSVKNSDVQLGKHSLSLKIDGFDKNYTEEETNRYNAPMKFKKYIWDRLLDVSKNTLGLKNPYDAKKLQFSIKDGVLTLYKGESVTDFYPGEPRAIPGDTSTPTSQIGKPELTPPQEKKEEYDPKIPKEKQKEQKPSYIDREQKGPTPRPLTQEEQNEQNESLDTKIDKSIIALSKVLANASQLDESVASREIAYVTRNLSNNTPETEAILIMARSLLSLQPAMRNINSQVNKIAKAGVEPFLLKQFQAVNQKLTQVKDKNSATYKRIQYLQKQYGKALEQASKDMEAKNKQMHSQKYTEAEMKSYQIAARAIRGEQLQA